MGAFTMRTLADHENKFDEESKFDKDKNDPQFYRLRGRPATKSPAVAGLSRVSHEKVPHHVRGARVFYQTGEGMRTRGANETPLSRRGELGFRRLSRFFFWCHQEVTVEGLSRTTPVNFDGSRPKSHWPDRLLP